MATLERPNKLYRPPETHIIDGVPVRTLDVCVHQILMGDVEDPDLYASLPLCEWERSEAGQWVMRNATETPYWIRQPDVTTFGFCYQVRARLTEQNYTYWKLRFEK